MSHALTHLLTGAIFGTLIGLTVDDWVERRSRRRVELRRFPRVNTPPPIAAIRRDPSPTPRERQRAS